MKCTQHSRWRPHWSWVRGYVLIFEQAWIDEETGQLIWRRGSDKLGRDSKTTPE